MSIRFVISIVVTARALPALGTTGREGIKPLCPVFTVTYNIVAVNSRVQYCVECSVKCRCCCLPGPAIRGA